MLMLGYVYMLHLIANNYHLIVDNSVTHAGSEVYCMGAVEHRLLAWDTRFNYMYWATTTPQQLASHIPLFTVIIVVVFENKWRNVI